jgi:DNA polymerase
MQLTHDEIISLRATLEWYRDMGVDIAIGDEPVDRFAAAKAPAPQKTSITQSAPAPAGMQSAAPTMAPPADDRQHFQPEHHNVDEARKLAAACNTLDELREAMTKFEGCPLKFRATNMVFADGNPDADIMLVGEAPGREEDLQGTPFVGRAGDLLDRILASIGLTRDKVFIGNTLPWRPPGDRNPTPAETAVCLPFLTRKIELVAPKIIITLGAASSKTIFDSNESILRLRGKWREIEVGAHKCEAIATLHPAYLLKQPAQKALVWRDMLALKQKLAQ